MNDKELQQAVADAMRPAFERAVAVIAKEVLRREIEAMLAARALLASEGIVVREGDVR